MDTPLRVARKQARKTLTEVAQANGLAKGSLSRIETAKRKATTAVAERLAKYFGTVSEIEILYPERFVTPVVAEVTKRRGGRARDSEKAGAAA